MSSSFMDSAPRFSFIVVAMALSLILSSCQTSSDRSSPSGAMASGSGAGLAPGAKLFSRRTLEGSAYTVDGTSTKAQAIVLDGEGRRPLFLSENLMAFAKRRSEFDRWQVFEADLSKETERRVSFDAGDAEPVAKIGSRLVIATSSELVKSSERVLTEYRSRFRSKESKTRSEASESDTGVSQHLLIEIPASRKQGTEWIQMSREPSKFWKLSFDRDSKIGIALLFKETSTPQSTASAFRISVSASKSTKKDAGEIRTWQPLRVPFPVIDAHVTPDGRSVVWSDGSRLWTTTLQGADSKRIGDDSLPGARQLTVDPTGRWVVYSTPSDSQGLNLMVVNISGKCSRALTELSGDELEPAFSDDGATLLFTHRTNGTSVIAKIPFGTPEAIAAPCT